jgi:hypothetical protein
MAETVQCNKPAANDDSRDRTAIINRARVLLADIEQTFADAEHWNRVHPYSMPIDPDPDGQLARIKAGLVRMLQAEARLNCGPR